MQNIENVLNQIDYDMKKHYTGVSVHDASQINYQGFTVENRL
ncbi:hypothetical protein [Bacillus atrophaeus]|nr:hypothetical protein [Bacillus atrophaeus]MEC2308622.1 hypothetical protein [Bacillus atrophaeus]